jgi:hypothetical protein
MRKHSNVLACALVVGGLATTAFGQRFNIDLSHPTDAAGPAPAATFGAAAGQPGVWNNITSATAAGVPLVDLAGNPTAATLSLTSGGFMFNANNSSPNGVVTAAGSNEEFLMDDVWDSPANGQISIANLAAGQYSLYVYAGSPDSGTTTMQVVVGAETQPVGGLWSNPFTFQQGVTHALFNVNHAGGTLNITFPDVPGFESVNGLQIAAVPEPASAALALIAGAFALRRARRRA